MDDDTRRPKRGERRNGTRLIVRATSDELTAIHAAAAARGTTAADLTRQALISMGVPITR